jgi:hypothetical protein
LQRVILRIGFPFCYQKPLNRASKAHLKKNVPESSPGKSD